MPRKPPSSTESRLVRWQRSMTPGTVGGRVAAATPVVQRVSPRIRQQPPGGFDSTADPVVIGLNATAALAGSVSIGHDAGTFDGNSVAIGFNCEVTGDSAVGIGVSADTNGTSAIAIGGSSLADADYTIAIGQSAKAHGVHSVAVGYRSYCATAADSGICIGDGTVDSDSGICIGANLVTGFAGVAIGHTAQSTRDYQITLGGALAFVEIPGTGTVYHSPDGTRWLHSVDNSGNVVVVTAP